MTRPDFCSQFTSFIQALDAIAGKWLCMSMCMTTRQVFRPKPAFSWTRLHSDRCQRLHFRNCGRPAMVFSRLPAPSRDCRRPEERHVRDGREYRDSLFGGPENDTSVTGGSTGAHYSEARRADSSPFQGERGGVPPGGRPRQRRGVGRR